MSYSRVTKIGDGATNQFAVNFALGYLNESDVTARVADEVDGLGEPAYRTITFLSENLLQISGTVPALGEEVVFERTVDKEALNVNFSNGDVLEEVNLDIAQKQAAMAVHEVLDGRFSAFAQDVSAGGFRITDLGPPVDITDATNKEYVDDLVLSVGTVEGAALGDLIEERLSGSDNAAFGADHALSLKDGQFVLSTLPFQSVLDLGVSLVEAIPDISAAILRGVDLGVEVYIPKGKWRLGALVGRSLSGESTVAIRGAGRGTKIIVDSTCTYGMFFNTSGCTENYGGVTLRDFDLLAGSAGTADWAIKIITGPRTKEDEGKFKFLVENVVVCSDEDGDYFKEGIILDGGPGVIQSCTVRGTDNDYRKMLSGVRIQKGVEILIMSPQIFYVKECVVIGDGINSTEGTTVSDGHLVVCDTGVRISTTAPGDLHVIRGNHINAIKTGVYAENSSPEFTYWAHVRNNTILRQVPRVEGGDLEDGMFPEDTGTLVAATSTTATLGASAIPDDTNYIGRVMYIASGTGSTQTRKITAYNTGTKVATLDTAWTVTPDATSMYYIEHINVGIDGYFKESTIVGNVVAKNNGPYNIGIRLMTGSADVVVDGNITQNSNGLDIVVEGSDASGIAIGLNHSSSGTISHGLQAITVAGANTGIQVISQGGLAIMRASTSLTSGIAKLALRSAGTGDIEIQGGDALPRLGIKGTTGTSYPEFLAGSGGIVYRPAGTDTNVDSIIDGKGNAGGKLRDGTGAIKVEWGTTGLSFFGGAEVAKPTGVAVTAAGIHAALVSLGLIAA